MDDQTLNSRIKEIQSEMSPYLGYSVSFFDNILTSSLKTYSIITFIILLILVFSRPSFLYTKTNNNKKFSYKKFLITWILISAFLCGGLFFYNYKKKNN